MKKFKRINQLDRVITIAYLTSGLLISVGYFVTPLVMNLYNVIRFQSEWNYDMPLKADFFYDVTKSPGYELSYLLLTFIALSVVFISVSVYLFQ